MGREFRTKGVNVALAPVLAPLGRIAEGGRNWENFAADPYLDGVLGAQSVKGLQNSVIASVKHFIAYEQETNRNPIGDGIVAKRSTTNPASSSNVDDQTMHELYLWPFEEAVEAGAACIMCSYNRINQSYACENSKTLNGILKGELNFQGFVLSDWGAQHSLLSANAGLDMAMPSSTYWNGTLLVDAVKSGTINKSRLVDMATRIVAAWYFIGQDNATYPELGSGLPLDLLEDHRYVDARDPDSAPSILQQAVEGHVLVKNVKNALPLTKPKVLSIFGYDATEQNVYVPSPTNFGGISFDFWALNQQAVTFSGPALLEVAQNEPPAASDLPLTFQGTLYTGGGSGSNSPPYISSPYSAIAQRAIVDGTTLFHDFNDSNPNLVASSSACLVFVNEWASEEYDRPGLAHPGSDQLVTNVANSCNNTIVVIHNAGIRLVDAWIDHPNVTAVLYAHLPGQDSGRSLVEVLYGNQSPSGRLPYTVAKQDTDYGSLLQPCTANQTTDPQCDYDEGVAIDYRWFLAWKVEPRFAFGYGLTYSNFTYSALNISKTQDLGVSGLFETVVTISATITNTGKTAAAEVAQLYVTIPGGVTKQLRGFQKVFVEPGKKVTSTFSLRKRDLSRWNVTTQAWAVPPGEFVVEVGASVLDTRLNGTFAN